MVVTIVGSQLGDEGKGRIVDVIGDRADIIVRYQGGDNAGHTVVVDGETFELSLVPSGAVRGKIGVLGNGCVINPETLFDEIDELRQRGLDPTVRVAGRAHVILPYHRVIDSFEDEQKASSDLAAGTTGRGIGPAYEDKVGRRGVRVADLLDESGLRERLEYVVEQKRQLASDVYGIDIGEEFDLEVLFERYRAFGERLDAESMVVDAGKFLTRRRAHGDQIIFEGAQGTSLDIDHGIYPYTTSSNTTAGFAATGSGVGPGIIGAGEIIGVVKAYLSRVGAGPLPSEIDGDLADDIRDRGGEYGTVTGRPRRIGWLDLPMLRTATRASGLTGIALNHIDVLAGLESIQIATKYETPTGSREDMPQTTREWANCEPVYREFDSWPERDWSAVAAEGFEALPEAARVYCEFIESELGVPIVSIGVGPAREETIVREHPLA